MTWVAVSTSWLLAACGQSDSNASPPTSGSDTSTATSTGGTSSLGTSSANQTTAATSTAAQTVIPTSQTSTIDNSTSAITPSPSSDTGDQSSPTTVTSGSTSTSSQAQPSTTEGPSSATSDGATTSTDVAPTSGEDTEQACGAKYTAIGDGGWLLCVRLADGGGACSDKGTATFHRVTFDDGSPITNVAQVSGFGDTSVGVVTTDGALHTGVGPTGISKNALIAEGVVNVSGGYHSRVALTKTAGKFGVVGWVDTGSPAAITLPAEVTPVQVSGNYGVACVLASNGDVYCWDAGGNHNIMGITATPSKVALDGPVSHVSVGQNTVCGVTLDNKLTCVAAWYDNPWLPSEGQAPDFTVRQSTFPEVREVHAGFHQGIIVDQTGVAHFLESNGSPGQDNAGSPFAGVTDVVAAGGDRGNACVQSAAGELYCWVGGATRATLDGTPVQVAAADCPF